MRIRRVTVNIKKQKVQKAQAKVEDATNSISTMFNFSDLGYSTYGKREIYI
jgi:hypothetical protein